MTVVTAVRTAVAAALIALPLAGTTAVITMDATTAASAHVQPADTPWGPNACTCGTGS